MATLTPPLERANGLLRLNRLPFRIRQRRHSQWLSVYELGAGGASREKAMRGYAAAEPAAVEKLCAELLRLARPGQPFPWEALARLEPEEDGPPEPPRRVGSSSPRR